MGYSPDRKTAVLKRMLAPNNMALRRLSQAEGISEATLHKWRAEGRGKGQLLPGADVPPQCWPCGVVLARQVCGGAGGGGAE